MLVRCVAEGLFIIMVQYSSVKWVVKHQNTPEII